LSPESSSLNYSALSGPPCAFSPEKPWGEEPTAPWQGHKSVGAIGAGESIPGGSDPANKRSRQELSHDVPRVTNSELPAGSLPKHNPGRAAPPKRVRLSPARGRRCGPLHPPRAPGAHRRHPARGSIGQRQPGKAVTPRGDFLLPLIPVVAKKLIFSPKNPPHLPYFSRIEVHQYQESIFRLPSPSEQPQSPLCRVFQPRISPPDALPTSGRCVWGGRPGCPTGWQGCGTREPVPDSPRTGRRSPSSQRPARFLLQ